MRGWTGGSVGGRALLLLTVLPWLVSGQEIKPRPPERPILIVHEIIRDGVMRQGFVPTLPRMMLDDVAVVWPGLPVLTGKERVSSVLGAQSFPDSMAFELQPLRFVLAGDSTAVFVYGVIHLVLPGEVRGRFGRYMMAWRRVPTGWRLGALAVLDVFDGFPVVWPDSVQARGPEALLVTAGTPRPFVQADLAMAAAAGRGPASTAFREWAATDAVTFGPAGILNRGPSEIATGVRALDHARWQWRPVAAGAADDGSLGWTAGEATITVPATENQPERVIRSTYLTLWQRQPDGSIKFIADGGGTRP